MAEKTVQTLDLTTIADRPIVKLQQGDFEIRHPEELTFSEFGRQQKIGAEIIEQADKVAEDGVLEFLEDLVVEASQIMFVELPEDVARALTPGMYLKIARFFNGLTGEEEPPVSKTSENSAPSASDSMGLTEVT